MTWETDVAQCVRALPSRFSLDEVYAFAPELSQGRSNQHVEAQIRKQLQNLRENGTIRFLEPGQYEHVATETASNWPLEPGEETNRAELCEFLGIKPGGLDRKGMHKNAKGKQFWKDMLIFHQAGGNPYGDRFLPGDRVLYTGEGQTGDQKLARYNRYLADHMEEGIRVHLFYQAEASSPRLEYRGQLMVDHYEYVYRPEEGRRVYQFLLAPLGGEDIRSDFGAAYREGLQAPPPPSQAGVSRPISWTRRKVRDRAFGQRLRELYQDKCAVCRKTMYGHASFTGGHRVDLQGAHIQPVAHKGNDFLNNGICLCARHHWAFDHGIFSLANDHRVILGPGMEDPHGEIVQGQRIELPQGVAWRPHPDYLDWHRSQWDIA